MATPRQIEAENILMSHFRNLKAFMMKYCGNDVSTTGDYQHSPTDVRHVSINMLLEMAFMRKNNKNRD